MEQKKKERKPIVTYLISSAKMYLYTLIFTFVGFVFVATDLNRILVLVMGIVFIAPVIILNFISGKKEGDKEYKRLNKSLLTDVHKQTHFQVKTIKSVFHVLGFFLSALVLILIAELCRWQWLQGAMLILFTPTTLIFKACGILDISILSWFAVLPTMIYVVLCCASFILGYVISVSTLRRRDTELVSEIRSYM